MKVTKNVVLGQKDCDIIKNFYYLVNEICNQRDDTLEDVDCDECPFTKLCCNEMSCIEVFTENFSTKYFKISAEQEEIS